MPVVKGGVWTNVEDEILKASVSKYGLQQWARVSSLLARKTPKQCKARWSEWLDPGIRKIEWSKEEDEKLLQLAKLMPTQWRTIAPIVGRTATQCLERYQKLLDEAEARENSEFGLAGPDGGETAAPSADDVRRLRPGELDPDPESKPARPDTIDLDEDEKEMLSEARARLANTQGKKAKRKARERQLEESRRLASLQKRRELKNAGINIKITNRKKGDMDYNADIPFEKRAAPGFYDTQEEMAKNEREREAFDPRKKPLATRKNDAEEPEKKKRKVDKSGPQANQFQKIREAEQNSRRRPLTLPAPQVGEAELEDLVKIGAAGIGATPIRTPRNQDDRVAQGINEIRALTETRSSLLGDQNTPLPQAPAPMSSPRTSIVTPNPLATPLRERAVNGVSATPLRKGQERSVQSHLRSQLASLPKPKETEWELELPEEQSADVDQMEISEEDASERDRRNAAIREAEERAEFKRQTQTVQRGLPRPMVVNYDDLLKKASATANPIERLVAEEAIRLIAYDAKVHPLPGSKLHGNPPPPKRFTDKEIEAAKDLIRQNASNESTAAFTTACQKVWDREDLRPSLPGLMGYDSDENNEEAMNGAFEV